MQGALRFIVGREWWFVASLGLAATAQALPGDGVLIEVFGITTQVAVAALAGALAAASFIEFTGRSRAALSVFAFTAIGVYIGPLVQHWLGIRFGLPKGFAPGVAFAVALAAQATPSLLAALIKRIGGK